MRVSQSSITPRRGDFAGICGQPFFGRMARRGRNFLALILIIISSACRMPAPAANSPSNPLSQDMPDSQPTVIVSPSPTPVVAMAALAAPVSASGQDGPSLASPVLDPLNFTFPTSEPEAVSLWRPPLYPVPWEPTPNDHFYFTRPISADEVNWPLARYRYGGLLYSTPHTGIDIPAPKGTPILAAGPGTVIWAGYGLYFLQEQYQDPYGIAVAIKHDFGYKGQALYTIYGHMDRTLVYRGQHVEAGEQIGIVGETGNVSGPHLHFEVRVGDNTFFVSRNPELWISPPQGWGVLVGRLSNGEGRPIFQQTVNLQHEETMRNFFVISYAEGTVNSDPYYKENLVLGDLPAGWYSIFINYQDVGYKSRLKIEPGMVTYFTFGGKEGFDYSPPPTPEGGFVPPDATATPTP